MNYVEIVNLVFTIIFGILTLLSVFYVIFAVVSVFKKKTFPPAEKQGNREWRGSSGKALPPLCNTSCRS